MINFWGPDRITLLLHRRASRDHSLNGIILILSYCRDSRSRARISFGSVIAGIDAGEGLRRTARLQLGKITFGNVRDAANSLEKLSRLVERFGIICSGFVVNLCSRTSATMDFKEFRRDSVADQLPRNQSKLNRQKGSGESCRTVDNSEAFSSLDYLSLSGRMGISFPRRD